MAKRNEFERWKIDESVAWLKYVRKLWRDISWMKASLDDTAEVIRRLAEPRGIDYARPAVRTSGNVDAVADVVAAMQELEQEWRDRELAVIEERREAERIITKLQDATHRQVLMLYYYNGKGWDEVAKEVNYSEDHCYDLRDQAALELHRFLPDGWRTDIPTAQ